MKNLISCTTSDMNFFEEQKYQNMLRDGVNTYFPADLKSEKQVNITIESSPHFLDLTTIILWGFHQNIINLKIISNKIAQNTSTTIKGFKVFFQKIVVIFVVSFY
jgi:hypothetical protein